MHVEITTYTKQTPVCFHIYFSSSSSRVLYHHNGMLQLLHICHITFLMMLTSGYIYIFAANYAIFKVLVTKSSTSWRYTSKKTFMLNYRNTAKACGKNSIIYTNLKQNCLFSCNCSQRVLHNHNSVLCLLQSNLYGTLHF